MALDGRLPEADLVIVTVPGPTVRLDALVGALDAGRLAGAALDVYETEPLPAGHPLWTRDDVLLTPHVAGMVPHADERRLAVLLENARRFADGRELVNVVDKAERFQGVSEPFSSVWRLAD